MTEQNQTTITYLSDGVSVANDLIVKGLGAPDWDDYCEYTFEVLKVEYDRKEILKIQDTINKFRYLRDKLASELNRTKVPDSRQIPMDIQRYRRGPDMTSLTGGRRTGSGTENGESLTQFINNRAQAMGFDLTRKVGRDVTVTAEQDMIDSDK